VAKGRGIIIYTEGGKKENKVPHSRAKHKKNKETPNPALGKETTGRNLPGGGKGSRTSFPEVFGPNKRKEGGIRFQSLGGEKKKQRVTHYLVRGAKGGCVDSSGEPKNRKGGGGELVPSCWEADLK